MVTVAENEITLVILMFRPMFAKDFSLNSVNTIYPVDLEPVFHYPV